MEQFVPHPRCLRPQLDGGWNYLRVYLLTWPEVGAGCWQRPQYE